MSPQIYRRRSDFQRRQRTLYALVFKDERAAYIGQSVDTKRRRSQHAATSGGWLRSFELLTLETIEGTFQEAETREYIWRWIAHLKGYTVYVQPPNVRVRLGRRMPWWRRLEAWRTWVMVGWPDGYPTVRP